MSSKYIEYSLLYYFNEIFWWKKARIHAFLMVSFVEQNGMEFEVRRPIPYFTQIGVTPHFLIHKKIENGSAEK